MQQFDLVPAVPFVPKKIIGMTMEERFNGERAHFKLLLSPGLVLDNDNFHPFVSCCVNNQGMEWL